MARKGINDLPDEILEYVIYLVSPYQDLHNCRIVCRRWQTIASNVARRLQQEFERALTDGNLQCSYLSLSRLGPSIAQRYSHAACYHEMGIMYVFGGCTSTSTTFNDLWQLDLSTRVWVRPLAIGTYPSPKACASLVCYNNSLMLFGGWTHPSPYPLHQPWRLFNELHIYDIPSNRWDVVNANNAPPPTAGHSATVHADWMVLFGGLQKQGMHGHFESSNDVWCYHCVDKAWHRQETVSPKPHARYGQSQIHLDENHLLIMGGCGRPNKVFSDIWLLELAPSWRWRQMKVLNPHLAASKLWCHPACKVGDKVVVLSRSPTSPSASPTMWTDLPVQLGRRSSNPILPLQLPPHAPPLPSTSASSPSIHWSPAPSPTGIHNTPLPSIRPNAMNNRKRQLDSLQRMEDRIRAMCPPQPSPHPSPQPQSPQAMPGTMILCVLDVSTAIESGQVVWLPRRRCPGSGPWPVGPEETILYSMVRGRAELIVFGGVQRDPGNTGQGQLTDAVPDVVSNALYFIQASKAVI